MADRDGWIWFDARWCRGAMRRPRAHHRCITGWVFRGVRDYKIAGPAIFRCTITASAVRSRRSRDEDPFRAELIAAQLVRRDKSRSCNPARWSYTARKRWSLSQVKPGDVAIAV